MNKKTRKLTLISSCVLMLLGIVAVPTVSSADEITVTGNGSNSSNTVEATATQQTTTQQTNTSQVNNNTSTNASTGNNTTSGNLGNTTSVQTGGVNSSTTVNNAANVSSVTTGCGCAADSTSSVTGNGEDSTNTLNVSSSADSNVTLNQTANISNSVSQYADTGHNFANGNVGNVTIKTGNINAQLSVKSGPVNVANVNAPGASTGSFTVTISGNGENSQNYVNAKDYNTTILSVNNSANIINNLKTKYITGENSANSNNGNVTIVSGNILGSINIENASNQSSAAINCGCQKENTKPTSPPVPTPTQPANNSVPISSSSSSSTSSSGSSGGNSSGGPGSVLGASANNLPVTGSYWFFIAFIGNILMMLLGGYLRLRSGRSPGFAYTM